MNIILNNRKQNQPNIDDSKALSLYNQGWSLERIGKEFHSNPDRISKRLKSLGITIVNRQNERGTDHTLFKAVDTEEKAYWLGFLYADGSIHSKTNAIELGLKLSDSGHLLKFKRFIKAENKLYLTSFSCKYSFYSKNMKLDLIKLGCIPRKTEKLKFPTSKQVPKHLQRHFIRGYFDGDGCLTYKRKAGILYPLTSFLGTKDILVNINKVLGIKPKNLRLASNLEKSSKFVFEMKISIKESENILKMMYENSSIYLDRKYKRFQLFKENNFGVQDKKFLEL